MPTGGPAHLYKLARRIEPTRGASALGNGIAVVLFTALLVTVLLLNAGTWPVEWPRPPVPVPIPEIAVGVLVVLLRVAALGALVSGHQWRTYRRIVRLTADPRVAAVLPKIESEPVGPFAPPQPPPMVRFDRVRPRWVHPRRRVKRHRNLVGLPPLRIAYLRVFENGTRARTFVHSAWREFGPVHMLRSAASLSPAEFQAAVRDRRLSEFVIDSEARFRSQLLSSTVEPRPPGWHRLRTVAGTTVSTYDRYGAYPVSALMCSSTFWRRGLEILLRERADLVVVDLSGYRENVHGTQVELQSVVDTVPVEKVLLLADPSSPTRFLEEQVRRAWSRMAAGSPNAGRGRLAIRGAVIDRLVRVEGRSAGAPSSRLVLRARKRQVRWLLRDIQRERIGVPAGSPSHASRPQILGTAARVAVRPAVVMGPPPVPSAVIWPPRRVPPRP